MGIKMLGLETLRHEGIIKEKNGCFPFALAGVFTLLFPDMSESELLRVTKFLLKPPQIGEELFKSQKDQRYKAVYTSRTGSSGWIHLMINGLTEPLFSDMSSRLDELGLPIRISQIPRKPQLVLNAIESGCAIMLPLVECKDGLEIPGLHAQTIGMFDDNFTAIDAENIDPRTLKNDPFLLQEHILFQLLQDSSFKYNYPNRQDISFSTTDYPITLFGKTA